jgi:acylphosphatase
MGLAAALSIGLASESICSIIDKAIYEEIRNPNQMKKLTALVSGHVQKVGYRAKVIDIANAFGLKGTIENMNDGRVKIIAEGDDEKLKWFESAINIKNTLIQVSSLEINYSEASGEFNDFGKIVKKGETDSRLDKGVEVMKEMLVAIKDINKTLVDMNSNLGGKMDNLGGKIDGVNDNLGGKIDGVNDNLGGKMDRMLQKQDETLVEMRDMNRSLNNKSDELLVEVKDMNRSLNDKMDRVLDKSDIVELKADVSEVKAALRAKGII